MCFCFYALRLSNFHVLPHNYNTHSHTHTQAWLLPAVVVVTSNFYPPPFIPSLSSAQKDDDDDEVEDEDENDADTSALEQQLTCKSLYILSVHVCAAAIVFVRICVYVCVCWALDTLITPYQRRFYGARRARLATIL